MASVIAPVNLKTLVLARKAAGYPTVSAAARAIDFLRHKDDGQERLQVLEDGKKPLSVSRAKKLAKRYGVPYTHLYLEPEQFSKLVPDLFQIADFRRQEDRHLTPNMIRFLREVFARQTWLRELVGERHMSFTLKSDPSGIKPTEVAKGYRQVLRINDKEPLKTLPAWIERIEAEMGVFVMQSRPSHYAYKVESEFGGAAFQDKHVPVIALNGADTPQRRLFTLIHELAHITHAGTGISRVEYRLAADYMDQREVWCNEVAAETLMPEDVFSDLWQQISARNTVMDTSKIISGRLGVSISAAVVRAARLSFIEYKEALGLLNIIKRAQAEAAEKKSEGDSSGRGMAQRLMARDRAGPAMTRIALQSYDEGNISARDLYDIFGVKLHHLPKIADQAGHQLVRWQGGDA